MSIQASPVLELRNVTKAFGNNVAVDGVDFALYPGQIHTLLGENGAGKSTLMNLIYGLYQPDAGEIWIEGKHAQIDSPMAAIRHGIGMVHQHFMLVPSLSVAENIALSMTKRGFRFRRKAVEAHVADLSRRYNLSVSPSSLVWELSVGLQQRVEIIKALAVEAKILILDEPTAVLSPQEIQELFTILRRLKREDRSIIFISHKLKEVMDISDCITVLRRGKKVATTAVEDTSPEALARHMVGQEIPKIQRSQRQPGAPILEVKALTVMGQHAVKAVDDCTFDVCAGEIVGIAGVDGNGQIELGEAIVGLRKCEHGSIILDGHDITNQSPSKSRKLGYGHIPEDRQAAGLVLPFTIAENLVLNTHRLRAYQKWGQLDLQKINADAKALIESYDVRTTDHRAPAQSLSGGNQQKVVIARELSQSPRFLLAVNPTRGLDIGATDYVHQQLLVQRDNGRAVLLISTELDEVLSLSDRIFVMYKGKLTEATAFREDLSRIGILMIGGSVGKMPHANIIEPAFGDVL